MKKNYLCMFMAIAMIASGASFFASCEKTPSGNEGGNTENNGGNQGGENQGGGNQEEGTYIDVKAGEDLQTAIFNAPKGAIVRVQGGVTFEGNIKFVEGVTLSGGWNSTFTECGAEDLENLTIIDAKGSGRALEQHRIKPEGSDAYADYVIPTVVSGFELKGGNTEAIKADTEALQQKFYKLSEELYKQSQAQGGAHGAGFDAGAQGGAQGASGDGTYYDADFEDKSGDNK